MKGSKTPIICVPLACAHMNLTLPADRDDHGVVFGLFKLASVLESLKHGLPGLKALHALRNRQKKWGTKTSKSGKLRRRLTFTVTEERRTLQGEER